MRDHQRGDVEPTGDQRGPRQLRVKNSTTNHAVGERITHGHQPMGGRRYDSRDVRRRCPEGLTQCRIFDRRRQPVGDNHIRWSPRVKVLRWKLRHETPPCASRRNGGTLTGPGTPRWDHGPSPASVHSLARRSILFRADFRDAALALPRGRACSTCGGLGRAGCAGAPPSSYRHRRPELTGLRFPPDVIMVVVRWEVACTTAAPAP